MSLLTLRSATQSFRVSFQIRVSCSRTVHHRKFNKVQFSLKNKNKNSFCYRLVESGSWPVPCVEVHLTVSMGHILNLTLKHQFFTFSASPPEKWCFISQLSALIFRHQTTKNYGICWRWYTLHPTSIASPLGGDSERERKFDLVFFTTG